MTLATIYMVPSNGGKVHILKFGFKGKALCGHRDASADKVEIAPSGRLLCQRCKAWDQAAA